MNSTERKVLMFFVLGLLVAGIPLALYISRPRNLEVGGQGEEENIEGFADKEYVAKLVASHLSQRARDVCDSYLSFQLAEAMDEGEPSRVLKVSIRFSHELSDPEIEDVEAIGIQFVRVDGVVLHAGAIYPASGSVEAINALAQWEIVLGIESAEKPKELP